MKRLPVVSASKLVKALSKVGYSVDHQTGSHIILRNALPPFRRLTIPDHKEISKGTLKSILRQAEMTNQDLMELL
ncbi:MAG: type II toxin-antitoxin system HicA family toxin [Planctomycetes bacterium]|nr:type II toxin-antitoxin system HicA family toxin [Planctomycetota bacterium]